MAQIDLDLVRRLERLERENKNLKRWGLAALALAGAGLLASAAAVTCKTVWAERFVLKDPSSRDRAVLTAYETGGAPVLSLLDQSGKAALSFGVSEEGSAYLEVPGTDGPVRRQFALSPEGNPTLQPAPEKACGDKSSEVAQAR